MHCHKCGTEVPDEANFCWKCGAKLTHDEQVPHLPYESGQPYRVPGSGTFLLDAQGAPTSLVSGEDKFFVLGVEKGIGSLALPEENFYKIQLTDGRVGFIAEIPYVKTTPVQPDKQREYVWDGKDIIELWSDARLSQVLHSELPLDEKYKHERLSLDSSDSGARLKILGTFEGFYRIAVFGARDVPNGTIVFASRSEIDDFLNRVSNTGLGVAPASTPSTVPKPPEQHPERAEHQSVSEEQYEPFHWWMALAAGICGLFGIGLLISSASPDTASQDAGLLALVGLAGLGFAIAGTWITNFWRQVNSLPPEKKIIAWVPVVIGGASGVLLIVVLWIALAALGISLKDWERNARTARTRDAVERGVEDALKKRGF